MRTVLLALVAAFGVCQAAWAAAPPPPAPPRHADLYGDPLPVGAFARLGSTRFRMRSHCREAVLSPDGRTVLANCAAGFFLFSAETGKVIRQVGQDAWAEQVGWAPDGKTVYTV